MVPRHTRGQHHHRRNPLAHPRPRLDPAGRTFVYNSALFEVGGDGGFFPIDNRGFGNYTSTRNFHFTSEMRAYFQYRGGEQLDFVGDDDVWVFINGHLAVDIGGIHGATPGQVILQNDGNDERFDIFEGGVYEIALFQAERQTVQSNYRLTLAGFLNTGTTLCDILCGDGLIRGDEQCDDGNIDPADGCSANCVIEGGYNCTTDPTMPSECNIPPCGDGQRQIPEECDDSNTNDGDGCSATCQLENCGNNTVDPGETCDDGNQVDTDACSNACQPPSCGDRIVQTPEECDDGNTVNTDNCTTTCLRPRCGDALIGPGEVCDDGVNNGGYESCLFDCSAPGPRCGDGNVQGAFGETCDDGINDGTYNTCNPDCTSAPRCGDGQISNGEACDDANALYGDGCDGTCAVETGYICTGTPSDCIRIN
jgi:fibro-slime domain-containing protein